jgi:hypothetical protein
MRQWPFLALAALCAAGPASATTYTVATSGSDSNNGVSAPFRTLQKAAGLLQDGDTIVLQPGTYTAGAYITRRNITVRGESAVLDGASATRDDGLSFSQTSGITVEGVRIQNTRRKGLFVTLTQGLTVRNCEFVNNASDGFLTGNTSDVLVENCLSSGNGYHGFYCSQSGDRLTFRRNRSVNNQGGGIQVNAIQGSPNSGDASADSLSKNCTLEGNTITGCGSRGGSALNLMGVQSSVIANNLLVNNLAGGIALWDDGAGSAYASKNNKIYHNTVLFASGRGRYGVQVLSGCTGNEILNNILATGSGPALETGATVRSNFNCLSGGSVANGGTLSAWQNATGNDLNSLAGVPALTSDYHPAAGSAARDAGSQVLGMDLNGSLRPQGPNPDLGCFEETYGSGGDGGTTVSAPNGLVATPSSARVDLDWNSVSGASGYHVYRSATQGGSYTRRTGSPATSLTFADTGLTNGTTYWYRVTALSSTSAESTPSASVSATPAAATVQTYTISGQVTAAGVALSGVLVAGGGQSTLTTANGDYTLSQVVAGSYTLTASRTGYVLSAPQAVTVGPSRTGVDFTATVTVPPTGAEVIYGDNLRSGWTSKKGRAKVTLTATSPVAQGTKAISLLVSGVDGYAELSGAGIAVSGKSYVKFSIHGGSNGGQRLRVRAHVNGERLPTSLNLSSYGGLPTANGWREYTIPLTDLGATSGNLTGVVFFAGQKEKRAYIDFIRVE